MTYLSLCMLGIALSVSTLFGYVITASLLPCSTPRRFIWTLTPAVGLGICSMIFFLFRRPMFTVESTLAAAACWYLYRRKDNLNLFHAIGRPSLFALVLFATNNKISKITATYRKRIRVEFGLVEPPF